MRDHGTGDKTTHCRAHRASRTPRHHRDQRLESPGKKFSPKARGKCPASPTKLHYVTVHTSQLYFPLAYLIIAQISRIGRFVTGCLRNPPDTLLKIAPRFSYAVESPGSWVTVGELK